MNWTIFVLIICCLLAVFTVWKEYQRAKRPHLFLRILASLLAITALACIALPINYSKDITSQNDHSAILLTKGFEPDSLNNYKNSPLFTADKSITKAYPKVKFIRLNELQNDSPKISKLHVFGYGLNDDELLHLDSLPVVFHPSSELQGVTSIAWKGKLKTGETLKVQGKYKNKRSRSVKLVLNGLSTQLDTLTIAAKTNSDFELNTVPKNEGRTVYHLQAIAGTDTLANENLPVEVEPVKPLKILVLSASPDFETRFLKNWLSENGFSVAVRSTISKDKFSSEYVNMSPLKVDRLSGALLDKFDLVIGDLSVLRSESAILKQQVTQKGLGLIIRADSSSKASSWLQNDFPVERSNVKNTPTVSLVIKDRKDKTAEIKIDPTFIRYQPGTQPLVNDAQNHILVNTSLVGAGRMVFTNVNNTFNWMLAGNKDDYAAFWSLLIAKAVRKAPVTENWSIASQLPTMNEPVQLLLNAPSAPTQISADRSIIPPKQNSIIPFEWDNTYWPTTTGWHSIKQNNGALVWWYTYNENEWQSARASKKTADTRQYAKTYETNASVTKPIHQKLRIEVPKIYFYLLLLAACTFLWVEGKVASP
jgi:hypothetical protein